MTAKKKKCNEYIPPSYLAPDAGGKYAVNDELTQLDVAFPANVRHLMPDPTTVPSELKFAGIVSRWFFSGLAGAEFVAKPGVAADKALVHLKCILGSFEPKHEHKEAAVAFLLEQWFERIEVP